MKFLTQVLLLSTLIFLSSCDKENETTQTPTSSSSNTNPVTLRAVIDGDWELTSVEQQNGVTTANGVQTGTFTGKGKNFVGHITFNPNGSTKSTIGYDMDISLTVNPALPPVTQTVNVPQGNLTGTYTVLSNTEIATSGAVSSASTTFEVSNLTATNMTWKAPISESPSAGITSSFDLVMTLQKK